MGNNHFAEKFIFSILAAVGYNGGGLIRSGIQRKRFSSVVGYKGDSFPPLCDTTLWDITRNNLRICNKLLPLHPTMRSFSTVVSHTAKESSPLYPTTWINMIQHRIIY
jgi:hypothetical protein